MSENARIRTALADRMGFAWEPEELPDMTAEEAREILRLEEIARLDGTIGNEYRATLEHARAIIAAREDFTAGKHGEIIGKGCD